MTYKLFFQAQLRATLNVAMLGLRERWHGSAMSAPLRAAMRLLCSLSFKFLGGWGVELGGEFFEEEG